MIHNLLPMLLFLLLPRTGMKRCCKLRQPVAVGGTNNKVSSLLRPQAPLSFSKPSQASRALVLLGVIFCAPPAVLIKYWNLPEWLHRVFSKSVVLDTERLGAFTSVWPGPFSSSPDRTEGRENTCLRAAGNSTIYRCCVIKAPAALSSDPNVTRRWWLHLSAQHAVLSFGMQSSGAPARSCATESRHQSSVWLKVALLAWNPFFLRILKKCFFYVLILKIIIIIVWPCSHSVDAQSRAVTN